MADAYDLRSNIKNKPGAQGTLFQVKDKGLLNPQQRWPQGYTPDRLNAVRAETRSIPISAPDHMYDQPEEDNQRQHGTTSMGYRERVNREIAKTNVPPEHLRRISEINGDPDEGTHGTYWKGGAKDRTLAVDMTDRDPHEARQTLTHEIGHHVNMTLAPTPHVHQMVSQIHAHDKAKKDYENGDRDHWEPTATDTAMQYPRIRSGVDEAQADDYMVKHYSTGGRKPRGATEGRYEQNFSEHQRKTEYPGYNDVRPPQENHGETWHAMQQNQFQPGLFPKSHGEGNIRAKIAAQADANRQALASHIAAVRGSQT